MNPASRMRTAVLLTAAALAGALLAGSATASAAGGVTLVSVSSAGAQSATSVFETGLDGTGRYVSFTSAGDDLVRGDSGGRTDVFVRDTVAGTTERVSVSSQERQGNGLSSSGFLSDGGEVVTFGSSSSNLVPGDTNQQDDVFVRDRVRGTTERVSVTSGRAQAVGGSTALDISGDGRFVLFGTLAALVPDDTNSVSDDYVHDRATGRTERVSLVGSGGQRELPAGRATLSRDGRYVAFLGASRSGDQVYLRDRLRRTTTLVSRRSDGGLSVGTASSPAVSADGRTVAFVSTARDLVAGDTNGAADVFVRDLDAGALRRVGSGGGVTDISGNGRYVLSRSDPGSDDLLRYDLRTGAAQPLVVTVDGSRPDGSSGVYGAHTLSDGGSRAAFASDAANLVPRDTNGFRQDAFLRQF